MAQAEGYRSRAAYKLKEIDEACQLSGRGRWWWTWVGARRLEPVPAPRFAPKVPAQGGAARGTRRHHHRGAGPAADGADRGVHFLQGDFREDAVLAAAGTALGGRRWTWWCRTWRPTCRASRHGDAARIGRPGRTGGRLRRRHLRPDGALVCKVFHGSGYSPLVRPSRSSFRVVKPHKPKASRDRVGRNLSGRHRSESRLA
jgi:23S rRNA (uridine2552-2'-O)-methyltransferase